MHKIYELKDKLCELKDKLCEELEEYSDKKLDAGNLAVIDSLSHTIKNLDKIIEKYEDEDYSSAYDDGMTGGPYERDGNRDGNRYSSRYAMARGRGRNARRDSMGRYSSDSRMMVDELRELMNDAPDERTKMEFKRFIEKMEQM
jgi:hypothetical protein